MIDSTPLSAFSVMDKSVLMSQFKEIVTVSDLTQEEIRGFDEKETTDKKLFQGKYHIVHSSGSTGTPKYFVYDESAWNSVLLGIVRGALWNMTMPEIIKFLIHGPRIVYIAATDGRYGGSMAVGDGVTAYILILLLLALFIIIRTHRIGKITAFGWLCSGKIKKVPLTVLVVD